MVETQDIKQGLEFKIAETFADILESASGSAAGYHAVSEWMTCPERARLRALGIRRIAEEGLRGEEQLDALDFGTLCHYIRGVRVAFGHQVAMETLDRYRREIGEISYLKAATLFGAYEMTVPRDQDSLEYLAIEPEVLTNIAKPGRAPIIRTVRYDTLAYARHVNGTRELFSFEAKTMSRSGMGSIDPYNPQGMIQVALWNANASLVAKYGEMQGVIFDCLIKTKNPSVDRVPRYYSHRQQAMALEYMRLPEPGAPGGTPTGVQFAVGDDGRFPRMLHACWGRWRPCEFIALCHEDSTGEYEQRARPDIGDE